MRTIVIAGLLVIALLGAVLGAIGSRGHLSTWTAAPGAKEPASTPLRAPSGMAFTIVGHPHAPTHSE